MRINYIISALSIILIAFGGMLLIPIFVSLGEPICEFIFGNKQAGLLLEKASWVMIPLGISQITTTILNSMGYEKFSFLYYCHYYWFVA